MKRKLIIFLKNHPKLLGFFWAICRFGLKVLGLFVRIRNKRIVFSSFGGRKYDDSPMALYKKMIANSFFEDFEFIWAFEEPAKFDIPRGKKVKIDSLSFFVTLLSSKVWIDNSGIDRGIGFKKKKTIHLQTWHGAPLKKICGEENTNSLTRKKAKREHNVLYCSQSLFDKRVFARVFNASMDSILDSDLPRNDELRSELSEDDRQRILQRIGVPNGKKVLLYMPTYREYLLTKNNEIFIKPPMDLQYWKDRLGKEYILLVRAHYAVTKSLGLNDDEFVKDVSTYPYINDLYLISDVLISDYSSAFFDYSILHKPMFCFAYDLEEYSKKRGLYVDLESFLPCPVDFDEQSLIAHILCMKYEESCYKSEVFSKQYAPHAGFACDIVISKLIKCLS